MNNSRFVKSLQLLNASIDFISLNLVFFLCIYVFREKGWIGNEQQYNYFGFTINFLWLITVLISNNYHEKKILTFETFTKATLTSYLYLLLGITIYLFYFRMLGISRIFLLILLTTIPVMLLINRFFYLAIFNYLKKEYELASKVIIIGYNSLSKKLVNYLEEDSISKVIVGYCEELDNVDELSNYPILSNLNGAMDVCKEHGISEIYSTIAPENNPSIYKLIQTADDNCIRFKIVPDLGVFTNQKMHVDFLKEIPVIMLRN